jgi:transposase
MNPWQGILWLAGLQSDFVILDAKKWNQERRVELTLGRLHRQGRCSECGQLCTRIHSVDTVRLRDLSCFGYKVHLVLPRFTVRCERCGRATVEDHWLWRSRRQLTWRFECHVSALCEEMTNLAVARLEGMNDKTVFNIDYGLLRLRLERQTIPELGKQFCMDEVYFKYFPEQDPRRETSFVTNLVSLDHRRVIINSPGRGQKAAEACILQAIPEPLRQQNLYFATDLHKPFHAAIRKTCPQAKIILDRFHLMKIFNEAMDRFRRRQFHLTTDGTERNLLSAKTGKWILLSDPSKLSPGRQNLLAQLKHLNERVLEALLIREQFVSFFEAKDLPLAESRWQALLELVRLADIREFNDLFQQLKHWLPLMLDYFANRTTTAVIEALNHKIKATKIAAYGYRNLHYFQLKILQRVGFLNRRYAPLPPRNPAFT